MSDSQNIVRTIRNLVVSDLEPKFREIDELKKRVEELERRLNALSLQAEKNETSRNVSASETPLQEGTIKTTKTDFSLVPDDIQKLTFYPRSLLTPTEFAFFQALKKACGHEYHILTKIGLWALIENKNDYIAWRKISQKHIDFVLCDPHSMFPVLAIELDDWTHNSPKQKAKDAEKDYILQRALMPILRILPNETYDVQELAKVIRKYFEIPENRIN